VRLLSIALTAAPSSLAQGDIDADLVQRTTVGPAPASAATSATTVTRSRRADFAFPASMKVEWRARVTSPITLDPVVDRSGRILVLHERGSLSMLDGKGTSAWSVRLGDATPGVSPAVLSDGTFAVYNFDDRLLRIDLRGHLASSTQLGLKGRPSALLPLRNGGILLAVDDNLVQLDQRGHPIARAHAEHPLAELVQSAAFGVLAIDKERHVHRFHATGQLSPQGAFGTGVAAVALAGEVLFAVTTGHQLLSLNLRSQTVRTLFSAAPNKTLQPWLTLGRNGVFIASSDGTLRGLSHGGRDLMRLVLGDGDSDRPGGTLLPSATTPALADKESHLMLASAGSETLLVQADGSHRRVPNSACLSPTSLTPMPRQRVLLTCRNGEIIALSADQTAVAPTPAPAAPPAAAPPGSASPAAAPPGSAPPAAAR